MGQSFTGGCRSRSNARPAAVAGANDFVEAPFDHPANRAIGRALDVYTVYAARWDPLAKIRDFLPTVG